MKVLYDISLLGQQYKRNEVRTGVFRVVENVAEHLALQPDCKLKFYSSISDDYTIAQSFDYLQTNKKLSQYPFQSSLFKSFDSFKRRRSILINDLIASNNLSASKRLLTKFQIRNLMVKEKLYRKLDDVIYKGSFLNDTDIYHSPIFPVTDEIKASKVKSIFITSYDLIAISHPQFFESGTIDFVKSVLNSITPDVWVLCISHATRNDLLSYLGNKVNPDRVKVTELAASDTFYYSTDKEGNKRKRKKYNIPDAPYILSLCTLEPRKNIVSVIKAFTNIVQQENLKDLNLVLGGSKGWLFEKIFEEVEASADIKSRIIITGFIDDEDLAAIYSDALFFAYPSFYEGFGLPPLEAMKCGTPVITSNTSSLPEVVGDAGIMVDPTDLDALCSAMVSVYKNVTLREQMHEKSLRQAAKFSWERCAGETVDAYKLSLS